MGKLRIGGRKRVWLTAALAFLLPGLGHLFNGLYARGLLLLAGLLLDYTAIFRLADEDGARHLLLIVYLILMLPVFYFVSVYDSLQTMEPDQPIQPAHIRLSHGILLTLAGLVMLALLKPPRLLLPWMNELAELAVGPLVLLLAAALMRPILRKGALPVYRMGRMTAAALLTATGALLISDLLRSRNDIALLGEWWPVLFVALGLEMVLCSTVFRRRWSRLRIDAAGMSAALVVAAAAFTVTQYADFPVRWLDQFNVDLNGFVDYGEEQGFRYDQNVIKVPLDPAMASLRVRNANGDVKVTMSGHARDIEIYSTVWVDADDQASADSIAEHSSVHVSPGREVVLEGRGQAYGDQHNRLPKINITIVLPEPTVAPDDSLRLPGDGGAVAPGSGYEPQSSAAEELGPTEDGPDDMPSDGEPSNGGDPDMEPFGERPDNSSGESVAGPDGEPVAEPGREAGSGASTEDDALETEDSAEPDTGPVAAEFPESQEDENVDETADSPAGDTSSTPGIALHPLVLEIDVSNGAVEVENVAAAGGVHVASGSGMIRLADIAGPVSVKGNDGSIEAVRISGESSLEIKNGSIAAQTIDAGPLYAATSNGNVELRDIDGDVAAETKNGEIDIVNAAAAVKADTLNGSILVDSAVVGGNWDLYSSVGEIELVLPQDGNYSVYGSVSFGKISTELPFDIVRKTVRGTVGGGYYRIHINATNSISIRSRQ